MLTVDPEDAADAVASVTAELHDALRRDLPRLIMLCLGRLPEAEGQLLVARQGDAWVEVNTNYETWSAHLGKRTWPPGQRGYHSLAFELLRHRNGKPKEKTIVLVNQLNDLLGLGLAIPGQVDTKRTPVVASIPAPEDVTVATVAEIRASDERDPVASSYRRASAVYRYTTATGRFAFDKLRFHDEVAGTKYFRRVAWVLHGGLQLEGGGLKLNLGIQLPLYNLPAVYARPDAVVVVVEGEKTAEAAKLLAPDCVVVTWEGGARNVQTTDWSPLAERDVVVVPDADDEGRKAAQEVITHIRLSHDLLAGRANAPRPSRRVVAELPPGLPRAHDAADTDPAGLEGWFPRAVENALQPDADIARLNEEYVFLEEPEHGGACIIYLNPRAAQGLSPPAYSRLSLDGFQTLFVNQRRIVPFGRTVRDVSLGQLWLESPDRRTARQLVCNPDPAYRADPDTLNVWSGFNTQPVEGPFPFIERLLWALAGERPNVHEYLTKLLALKFQRPHRLPKVAIVVRGVQGVGKSTFSDMLHLMVGRHAWRVNNPKTELLGQFNAKLENRVMVLIEELEQRTAKEAESLLKTLITSNSLNLNEKNQPLREAPNFSMVVITSNEDVVASSGVSPRRFLYLTLRQSISREELVAWNNATVNCNNAQHPELQGFMHHLMNLKLDDWDPSIELPETVELELHRAAGEETNPLLQWWRLVIATGRAMPGVPWQDALPFDLLHTSYLEFCNRQMYRFKYQPLGPRQFRHQLQIWCHGNVGRVNEVRKTLSMLVVPDEVLSRLGLQRNQQVPCLKLPLREDAGRSLWRETGARFDPDELEDPPEATLPDAEIPF